MENKKIIAGGLTETTPLYRYISLSQFISFIEKKETYISKVKAWEDTWEAPTSQLPSMNDKGELEYPIYSIGEDHYGQCWSRNRDSDALWRIYSPNKEGLLIQTTVQKFQMMSNIALYMIAPVIYYENLKDALEELSKKPDYHHWFSDCFLKRKAFEHEQEVRLVTLNDERSLGQRYKGQTFISIGLDPVEFIDAILIDPRANDYFVDSIQRYCNRAGLKCVPEKSRLYSSNVFETTGLSRKWVTV